MVRMTLTTPVCLHLAGSYKDLSAWKQAVDREPYRGTQNLPKAEFYG